MQVSLFDFDLPEGHIALRPASPRENAKLLHVDACGSFFDSHIYDLPSFFNKGDVLVLNDTKVFPARLKGMRLRQDLRAQVEVTLIDFKNTYWRALAKPLKRLKVDDVLEFERDGSKLSAKVIGFGAHDLVELEFDCSQDVLMGKLFEVGYMPLPPYIESKRGADAQDLQDYQTTFARAQGSVAAPTAGLHLSEALLQKLKDKGVELAYVTLHVGLGTFLPVKVDDTANHVMHAEWGEVKQDTVDLILKAKAAGHRIVAVGTTSLRLLESACKDGKLNAFADFTDIFIEPGYTFGVVDGLMTNFHLPKSTLFMLVSAFLGLERAHKAYAHAIENNYRFYSYGDGSLLWRAHE